MSGPPNPIPPARGNAATYDLRDVIPPYRESQGRNPPLSSREQVRIYEVEQMRKNAHDWLEVAYEEPFPLYHELHLLHPYPLEQQELAALSFKVRQWGWRAEQWFASIDGLDLSDWTQWTFMAGLHSSDLLRTDYAWDTSVPFRLPKGVPITEPDAATRQRWHPDATVEDVQDAAWHEMPIDMGGPANVALHGHLKDPGGRRGAALSRIRDYLALHTETIPDNPYDRSQWQHGARLKILQVAGTSGQVRLRPAFHPDVLSYTVGEPLSPPTRITALAADGAATVTQSLDEGGTTATLTITVTAGEIVRTYTVVAQ